jgi:hypothetical protein
MIMASIALISLVTAQTLNREGSIAASCLEEHWLLQSCMYEHAEVVAPFSSTIVDDFSVLTRTSNVVTTTRMQYSDPISTKFEWSSLALTK